MESYGILCNAMACIRGIQACAKAASGLFVFRGFGLYDLYQHWADTKLKHAYMQEVRDGFAIRSLRLAPDTIKQ